MARLAADVNPRGTARLEVNLERHTPATRDSGDTPSDGGECENGFVEHISSPPFLFGLRAITVSDTPQSTYLIDFTPTGGLVISVLNYSKLRHASLLGALISALLASAGTLRAAPAIPPGEPHLEPQISGSPGNGITIKPGDDFSLNLKGRIQLRYQLNVPPEVAGQRATQQLVTVGTVRLNFSGIVLKPELTYLIQLALAGRDYRDGATTPLYDAYFDWKAHRDFNLRVGQFLVPFDRLRTVKESALQMTDRPRPVQELTLDRDVGAVLYSEKFLGEHSPVALRIGAFGGGGANQVSDKKPGALWVGRVEARPLGPIDDDSEGDLERRTKPGLALGVAVAKDWKSNRQKTTTGITFVGGTTSYTHAAMDLVFKWRGAAFEGAYLWKGASKDRIFSVDEAGVQVVEATRAGSGWVLQASYVLDPPVEFAARFSKMVAASGTDPAFVKEVATKGEELGAGVNYYLNGHKLKLQTGWIGRMPAGLKLSQADHLASFLIDGTF